MKRKDVRKLVQDLRAGDEGKLQERLSQLKREQFNLRFQRATGQLEKTSQMREVRRNIARAKTILREKSPPAKV